MIDELIKIYRRDLDRLKTEIEAFEEEKNLWAVRGNIKNSSGNLCLHLLGNLNTCIGKNLGNTGYIRDREAEFNLKDVPKNELVQRIIQTRETIITALERVEERELKQQYPENLLGI